MERKERLATFSSNERFFIVRIGRDVWQHGVLEFLLPARHTQFRRAWFIGVIWSEYASRLVAPVYKLFKEDNSTHHAELARLCDEQRLRSVSCTNRVQPIMLHGSTVFCRFGCESYHVLFRTQCRDFEDYLTKLFPL